MGRTCPGRRTKERCNSLMPMLDQMAGGQASSLDIVAIDCIHWCRIQRIVNQQQRNLKLLERQDETGRDIWSGQNDPIDAIFGNRLEACGILELLITDRSEQ